MKINFWDATHGVLFFMLGFSVFSQGEPEKSFWFAVFAYSLGMIIAGYGIKYTLEHIYYED